VEVRAEAGVIPIPRVATVGEEEMVAEAAIEPSHAVLLPVRLAPSTQAALSISCLSARSFTFAAMMKSFSCKPLILWVWNTTRQ
jgi:hypothetical protein